MPVDLRMRSAARRHRRRRPACCRPAAWGRSCRCDRDRSGKSRGGRLAPGGAPAPTVDTSVRPWPEPATCIAEPVRLHRACRPMGRERDCCVGRPSQEAAVVVRREHRSPLRRHTTRRQEPLRVRPAHLRRHCILRSETIDYIGLTVNPNRRPSSQARGVALASSRRFGHPPDMQSGAASGRSRPRADLHQPAQR